MSLKKTIDEIFEAHDDYGVLIQSNAELANALIKVLEGLPELTIKVSDSTLKNDGLVRKSDIQSTIEMIKKKGS